VNTPIDPFVLDCVFHKAQTPDGLAYWRECVLQPGMIPGTQGYLVVWPDGSRLHTYHLPTNFL
jgi:hypothetical protein